MTAKSLFIQVSHAIQAVHTYEPPACEVSRRILRDTVGCTVCTVTAWHNYLFLGILNRVVSATARRIFAPTYSISELGEPSYLHERQRHCRTCPKRTMPSVSSCVCLGTVVGSYRSTSLSPMQCFGCSPGPLWLQALATYTGHASMILRLAAFLMCPSGRRVRINSVPLDQYLVDILISEIGTVVSLVDGYLPSERRCNGL